MNTIPLIGLITITLSLFPSCYIQKESYITARYLHNTTEVDIPGSGISYSNIPGVPDQTYTSPSIKTPNFDLKKQLSTIGVDTSSETTINDAISELSIDSVAMEVAEVDKSKPAANFSYFKKILMNLNNTPFANYQTSTPQTAGNTIIFQSNTNLKQTLLSNQEKFIKTTITTNGGNIPPTSFKTRITFRIKMIIKVKTNPQE